MSLFLNVKFLNIDWYSSLLQLEFSLCHFGEYKHCFSVVCLWNDIICSENSMGYWEWQSLLEEKCICITIMDRETWLYRNEIFFSPLIRFPKELGHKKGITLEWIILHVLCKWITVAKWHSHGNCGGVKGKLIVLRVPREEVAQSEPLRVSRVCPRCLSIWGKVLRVSSFLPTE